MDALAGAVSFWRVEAAGWARAPIACSGGGHRGAVREVPPDRGRDRGMEGTGHDGAAPPAILEALPAEFGLRLKSARRGQRGG